MADSLESLVKLLANLSDEEKTALANALQPHTKPIKSGKRKQNRQRPEYSSASNIPKGKGAPAARSNVILGNRKNLFERSEDFTKHKKDIEIDKKLWAGHNPEVRDRNTTVESTCINCGLVENVSSILVSTQDGECRHTCTECSRR